ncbi:MAG: response regulator [SAR202 cluster bacterium]|nr:response regulator [SAR202 cluster bacterium]
MSGMAEQGGTAGAEQVRVLVADDEAIIRILLNHVLTAQSYEVVLAEDGQEAIEILQRERFDLVITDITMPRATGMDVLHTSKTVDPACPVMLITGFPSEDLISQMYGAGAEEYIPKPFDLQSIKDAVARLLARKQGVESENRVREAVPAYGYQTA